jgi:hypothetical protein
MSKKQGIPKSFQLFGTTYNVVFDNKRMEDMGCYGLASYGECEITLSDVQGMDKLGEDRIKDCFYHEKVHMILDAMNERELSKNEKFVDVFAKLLRQSDVTAKY